MFKIILWVLVVAAAITWAFGMGVVVAEDDPLPEVYGRYNHITIYEDGSYEGQTIDGVPVKGCLELARCNDN